MSNDWQRYTLRNAEFLEVPEMTELSQLQLHFILHTIVRKVKTRFCFEVFSDTLNSFTKDSEEYNDDDDKTKYIYIYNLRKIN